MASKGITAKDLTKGTKGMSESEMLALCEEFLKWVEIGQIDEEGNITKLPFNVVPTFSAFADYIGKSRADVHEWLRTNKSAAKFMKEMVADTIAAGAMQKAYEPRMASFALKNWCDWEDAPKKKDSKRKDVADEKKAKENLREYISAEEKEFNRNFRLVSN